MHERTYYARKYVEPGKTRDTWYSDRNYVVFAVLGNVRNGSGFAGVETHRPLPFISDGRGLPDNITEGTKSILSDEHSATWMFLEEAESYDWSQQIHNSGVIPLNLYAALRENGAAPESWSGAISGPGIVTVTMQAADAILAQQPVAALTEGDTVGVLQSDVNLRGGQSPADTLFGGSGPADVVGGTRYYVRYRWTDKLSEYTTGLRERMDMLREAAAGRECRLVFDFDS